jgi:hypothetical protein
LREAMVETGGAELNIGEGKECNRLSSYMALGNVPFNPLYKLAAHENEGDDLRDILDKECASGVLIGNLQQEHRAHEERKGKIHAPERL